jgi:tritrans,polycis-undecaprenyl-diphosphate synthase [geranylgeranyl-diphosphate specific]
MDKEKLEHLALILDGNRRYAKKKNLPGWKGHEAGAEKVEEVLDWCRESGIKELTFYALSTENLNRDEKELNKLFELIKKRFKKFKDDKRIEENKTKIKFIGDLSLLPKDIKDTCNEVEEKTKNYNNYKLNFCIAYGGRLELIHAFKKLRGKKEITEKDIQENLWLSSEPDLIIRTGGRKRLSNFLPWQSTYSELLFLNKLWPEFSKEDLEKAIEDFKSRKRNFGK